MRRWESFGYVQDSWKATKQLTINVGLRYEVYAHNPFTEVANRLANFVPRLGGIYPVASRELPSPSGTNTDFGSFAPRLGIAYALNPKTVVRSSYGWLYYSLRGWPVIAYNPPFTGAIAYNNDPFDFVNARRLSQGFERPTTFSPINSNLSGVQEDLKTPNVQQWNLSIQREITSSTVLTVGYVGSKSTHAGYSRDINAPVPGAGALSPRRAYPQFATITYYTTDSNANFNTLQLVLEKRMSKGLVLQGSYNWAHCINDANTVLIQGDGGVQNPWSRRADRGNCEYDIRQRFVITASYQLSFGRGRRFLHDLHPVAAAGRRRLAIEFRPEPLYGLLLHCPAGRKYAQLDPVATSGPGRGLRSEPAGFATLSFQVVQPRLFLNTRCVHLWQRRPQHPVGSAHCAVEYLALQRHRNPAGR